MKTKLITFILLLALLFMPASSANAQGPNGSDVFLLGQNYTLKSDKTLDGSIAVIGGNVNIEEDAVVNGDIVVVGGNISMDGKVNGEVVIVGGNLTISDKINGSIVVVGGQVELTETAVVTGDITTMGGQVKKDPGAEVGGDIINNAPPIDIPDVPAVPAIPNVPNIPNTPSTPSVDVNINPFWEVASVLGRAIAVALIGMLLTLFLQPQLERVSDAITQQPLMAGSFGLLTLVVTPIAIIIMAVTILLIPVALIVVLLLPLAWLFGMVALGQEVGERFTKAVNQIWAPVLTTGFGTFLLVLIVGFVGMIPCFGWLLSFLVTLLAMGGVAMTLFGSRSAPGRMATNPQIEVIPPAS